MKRSTKQIGDWGESLAEEELRKNGYEIVERNFRTRFGEIDVIARDGDILVFVEVKAKKDTSFGSPAEMVTKKKREKIKRTAESYIQEVEYDGPWRVDVVAIEGDKENARIEILRNVII